MTTERWTDAMLDQLADSIRELHTEVQDLTASVPELREESKAQREESKAQREEIKELNIRLGTYQQASQWVVNLALGLLATATITTIVSAVVRR